MKNNLDFICTAMFDLSCLNDVGKKTWRLYQVREELTNGVIVVVCWLFNVTATS